ncbi:hypothetical protein ACUIJQ_08660 [Levilactobacillus hammesii]|uniref:hypothetical protein n=1 Tax=Levilactobacillus hammesii TaxID=267633 RepID=UPI00070CC796|nr:hypothetical protein [Levilactobacillus hammesii]
MIQLAVNGKILTTPKVLHLSPLLLFTKLETSTGDVLNCLIHQHGLNFLYQADIGSRVAIYGHYNSRQQFVIEKFTVLASQQTVAS